MIRDRRILIVEDNLALLGVLGKSLRDLGYDVTSTSSGEDALCLLQQKPPDILLLDLMLPGIDGYGVLRSLGPCSPPVIVMTGCKIDVGSFDSSRVIRVLTKPFEMANLAEAIRAGLDSVEAKESASAGTDDAPESAQLHNRRAADRRDDDPDVDGEDDHPLPSRG